MEIEVKQAHFERLINKGIIVSIDGRYHLNSDVILHSKKQSVKLFSIIFNKETRKFENITPDDIIMWEEAYPAVAIEQEIKRAEVWLHSNPTKTKSNYKKFLDGWFSRTQNKGGTIGYSGKKSSYYKQQKPQTLKQNIPENNYDSVTDYHQALKEYEQGIL